MKNQLLFGAIAVSVATFGIGTTQAQALDLTGCNYASPSTCTGTTNGGSATFTAIDPNYSTGTGVFDPFLSIQNNGTEEGFNTDATPLPLDTTRPQFTNMVNFSSVDTSSGFVQLFLDLNESNGGSNPLLTLDKLDIYLSNTANIATLTVLQAQDKIFSLGESVFLNDQNAGQGRADLLVSINSALFSGHTGQYFYLYSKFSNADASFEEWSYKQGQGTTPPKDVPTPAAVLPVIGGLFGLARRKKTESAEA